MSILERLKAGTYNTVDVQFYGETLKIRLLSEAELAQARIEAHAYAKQNNLDEESLYREIALRQLFMALADSNGNKLAPNIDKFRSLLTRVETDYLIERYMELEESVQPAKLLDDVEFEKLVEEIKKSPTTALSGLNIDTLRRLIIFLVNQQPNSRSDSGSI